MAAYDVVTLDEVKVALALEGTALDEVLYRLISSQTLAVERRLGTQFIQRSVVEYHEGGGKRIYLQKTPIVSVTSIIDPGAHTIASSLYVIRQQRWLEAFGHFDIAYTTGGQPTDWTITYVCGWFSSLSAVAQDVKAEIIRAVAGAVETPAAGTASVSVGDLSVSYEKAAAGVETSPATDQAAAALYGYRGVLL